MKRAALVILAACNGSQLHPLPGQSVTPHLDGGPTTNACGVDVAFDETSAPYVRYRYAYDALGRLAHATGTFDAGPTDSIDYAYDHLDHMTQYVQMRSGSNARYEIDAQYDALGDLIDYTYEDREPSYYDRRRYAYSAFTDQGLPAHEVISIPGVTEMGYQLDYDGTGRIMHVLADDGTLTTYSYDDAESRTVTIDTGNGAYRGTIVYDDQSRELSETWDGTATDAIAEDRRYDYEGDRLVKMVYRSGTQDAPHALQTVEVDTMVYGCEALRTSHVPLALTPRRSSRGLSR